MIKIEKDDRSFYFCESADWSSVNIAESEADAARLSLSEANEFYGKELHLSACMRVKKIEESLEDRDILFRIEEVLADAGMHKESKLMSEILKKI
tara:strand:- start:446 stop:730 length:285 start_codon:yes stop_codon:yes gene_type:complete